jgi:hypothetical protein
MTKPSVKSRIVARVAVLLAPTLVFGLSACDNNPLRRMDAGLDRCV